MTFLYARCYYPSVIINSFPFALYFLVLGDYNVWYIQIWKCKFDYFGVWTHLCILEVHLEVFFLYLMDIEATAFAYFLVCFALLCTTFPIQLNLPGVVSLRTRNLTNVRSSSRWQLTGRASYRTIPPTTLQNLLNSSDEKKRFGAAIAKVRQSLT